MTRYIFEKYNCANCGAEQECKIYNTINFSLNPELKDDFYNNEINKFVCKKCGIRCNVLIDSVYHDMEKKYLINFVDDYSKLNDAMENFSSLMDDIYENDGVQGFDGYNIRFACNIRRVREKIIIFDNDLDDKVIEFYKLMIIKQLIDHNVEFNYILLEEVERSFSFLRKKKTKLQFLVVTNESVVVKSDFEFSKYNEYKNLISDEEIFVHPFIVDISIPESLGEMYRNI